VFHFRNKIKVVNSWTKKLRKSVQEVPPVRDMISDAEKTQNPNSQLEIHLNDQN